MTKTNSSNTVESSGIRSLAHRVIDIYLSSPREKYKKFYKKSVHTNIREIKEHLRDYPGKKISDIIYECNKKNPFTKVAILLKDTPQKVR